MSSEDTALEQAITDYNQTEKAIKPDTLYHLFARQTVKTPENVAIECQGRAVTYQELQVMSNRISVWKRRNWARNRLCWGYC
ncbi:hypothetical protein ACO1DM_00015 [Bacillus velezensis]